MSIDMTVGRFCLVLLLVWGSSRAYRWGRESLHSEIVGLERAKPVSVRRTAAQDDSCASAECTKSRESQLALQEIKKIETRIDRSIFDYGDVSVKMEKLVGFSVDWALGYYGELLKDPFSETHPGPSTAAQAGSSQTPVN